MNKRPTVLIIDDDESLLKGLEFGLRKLGIDADYTVEPKQFLELAETRGYDLYLIDLHLAQGQSGLDLVDRIRAEQGLTPRLIVISASGDIPMIEAALRHGANDYILKPLDREHLAAKLKRYVMTTEMAELSDGLGEVAEGRTPGKLTVYSDIIEIDDRGVRLRGPHYLLKGSMIALGGDLVREIAGAAEAQPRASASCFVKVISTWPETDDGSRYGAYAEFDQNSSDLRWPRALRRWLATRTT